MRGRTERCGRVTHTAWCEEEGRFIEVEVAHPFLVRLDEHLMIASVTRLAETTATGQPDVDEEDGTEPVSTRRGT